MPNLAAPPRARLIDPAQLPELAGFTCAGTTPYEQEVDQIVSDMHAGYVPPGGAAFLLAEDVSTGRLIGVCAFTNRALPSLAGPIWDAAYIAVIGVHGDFRGYRLPDGSTRLGDFLLHEALSQIGRLWGNGPMPPVWALIAPENRASQRIFEHHEFGCAHDPKGKYDIWLRNRGVPVPQRSWIAENT